MHKFFTVSSLEKIFPNDEPVLFENYGSAFKNERYNFQAVAYVDESFYEADIKIESDVANYVTVRTVDLIPARFAKYSDKEHSDGYYIKNHGNNELYPDLLRPFNYGGEFLQKNAYSSFWITVDGRPDDLPVGKHEIKISLYDNLPQWEREKENYSPKLIGQTTYVLEVLDETLPELDVINTCWLHYDCICNSHNVEPFTDDFYYYLDKYVKNITAHGQNMLYVPMFTPPLDTAVNHYRKTIQLVKITEKNGEYSFDFSEAEKFIKFVMKRGVKYLELNHVATQWGANFCPKIVAEKDGELKRIFGWDTSSTSKEYSDFLHSYCKALKKFLVDTGVENLTYFHISDEPSGPEKANFIFIKNILKQYFPNANYMDALSDKSLYDDGIITVPVVGLHHYENFKSPYVYYCGGICQNNVTNRHFAMPSDRTRILGYQTFKNDCKLFLHWAVNFYNSMLSFYPINPYLVSDAVNRFVSGDNYIVYPYSDGCYDSLRHETLCESWQDYRALSLLASKTNKNYVLKLLEEEGVENGFTNYPKNPVWMKNFREKINRLIIEKSIKQ